MEQVENSRAWYGPYGHYENERETQSALDLIFSDHFSRNEPGLFDPLGDTLLTRDDYYMHLADLASYCRAQEAWAHCIPIPAHGPTNVMSDVSARTVHAFAN